MENEKKFFKFVGIGSKIVGVFTGFVHSQFGYALEIDKKDLLGLNDGLKRILKKAHENGLNVGQKIEITLIEQTPSKTIEGQFFNQFVLTTFEKSGIVKYDTRDFQPVKASEVFASF